MLTAIGPPSGPDVAPLVGLRERGEDDVRADRLDQTGALGQREELVWRAATLARGCCHRTSASTPDVASGTEVDDRLVEQDQLAAVQRPVQRVVRDEVQHRRPAHRRLVQLVPVATALLRAIHRGVGVVHELVRLGGPAAERDTDAGAHDEVGAAERERRGEDALDPLREVEERGVAGADREDRELVAAESARRCRPREPPRRAVRRSRPAAGRPPRDPCCR